MFLHLSKWELSKLTSRPWGIMQVCIVEIGEKLVKRFNGLKIIKIVVLPGRKLIKGPR